MACGGVWSADISVSGDPESDWKPGRFPAQHRHEMRSLFACTATDRQNKSRTLFMGYVYQINKQHEKTMDGAPLPVTAIESVNIEYM